jgi:hypothetical protein
MRYRVITISVIQRKPSCLSPLVFAAALLCSGTAFAQTKETIPAGSGTLSYTVTNTSPECGEPIEKPYFEAVFGGFSYTLDGTTTQFGGNEETETIYDSHPGEYCPYNFTEPITLILPAVAQQVLFTPGGLDGLGPGGTANVSALTYPKYYIESILYAPPGNMSSVAYTDSITYATTSSSGYNFMSGSTETFSDSLGFMGIGGSLGFSYGTSTAIGNTGSFTTSISQGHGISIDSYSGNPNAINHLQDTFIIWLNPAVGILQNGTTATGTYYIGTQLQPSGEPSLGEPEAVDSIPVNASLMMASSTNGGLTTFQLTALDPVTIVQNGALETLPGLANICANPLPVSQCTYQNQCGCLPSDFTAVLAQDPLLNITSTESPMSVNTDSMTQCTNPAASAKCRFVPIMELNPVTGQPTDSQVNVYLMGPECSTCDPTPHSFTQSDAGQATATLSESSSLSVGQTWAVQFEPLGTGWAEGGSTTWTWTYTESSGTMNSTAHAMNVNLQSKTVGCNDPGVTVYEDTLYHTYAFQQTPGNTSCP